MRITAEMLKKAKACTPQRELFKKLFPSGSPSSKEEALAAAVKYADKFDWCWASAYLLPRFASASFDRFMIQANGDFKKEIARLRKIRGEAINKAYSRCEDWNDREKYQAAYDKAWNAYYDALNPVEKAYQKAWNAYYDALNPVEKAYQKAQAAAFVEAWFSVYPQKGG